jgi:uncharacterized protein YecT (DUF1311 family)
MVKVRRFSSYSYGAFLIIMSLIVNSACAIDNPDAPAFLQTLQKNEEPYLAAINNPNNGTRDYLIAYNKYEKFLDDELSKAYQLVMSKLPEQQKKELNEAQRNWIKFREAEFELIRNNWTRDNFGSSSWISRGDYRCSIVRDRVLQLLNYASNYVY